MLRSRTLATPRGRREELRERAERSARATELSLPRRSGWREIASTELANEAHERYMEDMRWFHEMEEREAENAWGLLHYSTERKPAMYDHEDFFLDDCYDSIFDELSPMSGYLS